MTRLLWLRLLAALIAAASVAAPARAQTCPPGYYFASDGRCYPGPPPTYAPPVYDAAPPVAQPPAVFDGFALGLGLSALLGGFDHDHGDRGRGRDDRGHDDRGRGGGRDHR